MLDIRFPLWKISAMSTALKTWRVGAQLDAESAAREAGVSLPTWSRWETGRRRVPAERVPDLSKLTGIPMSDLRPDVFANAGEAA